MPRKRVIAAIGAATAIALVVAPVAQAFEYLISPYINHDTTYGFGQCRIGGKGTGTTNFTGYVVYYNSCYMDMIGARTVDRDGYTTNIAWDTNRDDVVHLSPPGGVAKYKLYKTIGNI